MVEKLQAKPGADQVGVTIGDFATTKVNGTFTLAYLVYNTITNLTTQDEQVECFRNVAAHLEPGGRFVIEVFVPVLQRLPPGETVGRSPLPRRARLRRVRRRNPDPRLVPLLGSRRQARDLLGSVSLCLAVRARPHGAAGRDDLARALERLEPSTLHKRERRPRVGLGEDDLAPRSRILEETGDRCPANRVPTPWSVEPGLSRPR